MAAGLGFKTFNTGDVLSAADVNGYLMQGVLVFADATARDAAITSPQEGQFAYTKDTNGLWYYSGSAWVASGATGDIEGVTAGTGISGGGTSGTVTITNSMATAIDAKGDLVVGTGADTFSRLAVGTNGYLLTADSTEATGMKWAAASGGGAYTLLSTTTLSGTSTTVSSISSAYKHLRVVILGMSHDGGGSPTEVYPRMRFNSDTGNNYSDLRYSANEDNSVQSQTIGAIDFLRLYGTALNNTQTTSQMVVDIFNYADTTVHKQTDTKSYMRTMGGGWNAASLHGVWLSTSAISSITFFLSTASFDNGTVYLYGVN